MAVLAKFNENRTQVQLLERSGQFGTTRICHWCSNGNVLIGCQEFMVREIISEIEIRLTRVR